MKRYLLVITVLALIAAPALAQQQYGSVAGTVVDSDGGVLPGVTVNLSGPALQGTRMAVTDVQGRYRFAPVPPGQDYTVSFELSGFNTLEQSGITVNIGRATAVDAEMSLSEFAETISVVADRVVVDTSKSTVDTTVDWELVDSLASTRLFQTMMRMARGVAGTNNNPAVNGGSNDGNLYLIDGIDTTDARVQTWGTAINYDTIAEAQLQTAAFQAELGRATGGILNLVTKSGGNNFSATARIVKSDADWSAKNGIDDETDANKTGGNRTDEERPKVTFGGPIIKDALWFYTAYEKRDNSRGYTWYDSQEAVEAGDALDGRTSYAGHPSPRPAAAASSTPRGLGPAGGGDGGDQPVAALGDGLDERGIVSRITEHRAQLGDRAGEHRVGDVLLGPHRVDQLLAADDLARSLDEEDQHVHHLGPQADRGVVGRETVELGLDQPVTYPQRPVERCRGQRCVAHSTRFYARA